MPKKPTGRMKPKSDKSRVSEKSLGAARKILRFFPSGVLKSILLDASMRAPKNL